MFFGFGLFFLGFSGDIHDFLLRIARLCLLCVIFVAFFAVFKNLAIYFLGIWTFVNNTVAVIAHFAEKRRNAETEEDGYENFS